MRVLKTIIAWVILLLLLGLSATAHDAVPAEQIVADAIDEIQYWDSAVAHPLWWFVERDTTRYYIKEIKQKCDTTHKWVRRCRLICCGSAKRTMSCVPQITCVDDTVWAPKVQVWLTPTQLEELMRIIERLKL